MNSVRLFGPTKHYDKVMQRPRTIILWSPPKAAMPVVDAKAREPAIQDWWPVQLVYTSSLADLIVPTILLIAVGQRIVATFPRCRLWGYRVAVLVLIVYLGERLLATQPTDGSLLLHLILRGLMSFGLVLGCAWCVFPIIATCWDLVTRALSQILRFPLRMLKRVRSISWRLISAIWPKQRLSRAKRHELEQQQRDAESRRQTQARLLAEQQQRERAHQQAEMKRREDARFACQVLYDRHRSALYEKFSLKQLSNYFERYLADTLAADEVEKRAEQLKEMILNIVEGNRGPRPRFSNVGEVHDYFKQQQQSVLSSDFSKDVKDTLISDLAREEIRAIREFRKI